MGHFTTDLSIFLQLCTGVIGVIGINTKVPTEYKPLKDVLLMETFVQFIELLWYILVLRKLLYSGQQQNAVIVRYYDWAITTPVMLFTLARYFEFTRTFTGSLKQPTLFEFYEQNRSRVQTLVVCNALMLLFGYLGETGYIDFPSAMIFGTLFFVFAMKTLHTFVPESGESLFRFVRFIWALYGVAALTDNVTKNNMYNILDLFSKNAFGLYLYTKIASHKL